MKEKRLKNFNELENHSIIKLPDIRVIYWNVHSFCEDQNNNHGVDAYFKWNDDVFFIQVMPLGSVIQGLGYYIKTSPNLEFIDFLTVVKNRVTKELFEDEVIKICKKIGKNNNYHYLNKMYSPNEKYKKFMFRDR